MNRHLRAGVDQIDEGMVFLQPDAEEGGDEPRIVFVNRGISALSGFRGEDLLGCPLGQLFVGDKRELLLQRLSAIAESRRVFEVLSPLACANGEQLPAKWKIRSVSDDDGAPLYFLFTVAPQAAPAAGTPSDGDVAFEPVDDPVVDRTDAAVSEPSLDCDALDAADREQAEEPGAAPVAQPDADDIDADDIEVVVIADGESPPRHEEQLHSARMETLALLAGGIAHDFKNVLTAVLANLSLVNEEIQGETLKAQIEDAVKASGSGCRMAEQLLEFARGGESSERVEADVGRLLSEAARLSTYGSKARCDVNVAADLWSAPINVTQVTQVINNLIINARQAMQDVGTVKANLANVELGPGEIDALPPGSYLRLDIIDHGCGIPADKLDTIFTPFYTTKPTGNGLGLANCQTIVREHGGLITVESECGRGSCFSVYLPATGEPVEAEAEEGEREIYSGAGSVLVVDDQGPIRTVAKAMLRRLGYEVTCAASGEEAVAKFRRARSEGRPFAVTLMDMTLPGGIDGNEATQQILAIDPDARVLSSSGYYDELTEDLRARGFVGVLSKPYDLEKMSRVLHEVLEMEGVLD